MLAFLTIPLLLLVLVLVMAMLEERYLPRREREPDGQFERPGTGTRPATSTHCSLNGTGVRRHRALASRANRVEYRRIHSHMTRRPPR